MLDDGLSFEQPICFLVGENGSGKSTIVEALAEAYGADVRGGHTGRKYASNLDKGELGERLRLDYAAGSGSMRRKPKGFFLRAETAYGVFEFMSDAGVKGYGEQHLLEVSHGESFLQVFKARFNEPGLYLLDEPEAALSFSSCLSLMAVLHQLAQDGGQVVCATHSPLLASLRGASILELSDAGIRSVEWDQLELVAHWRRYLTNPEAYLRHLL
jgi:predicted ATPase